MYSCIIENPFQYMLSNLHIEKEENVLLTSIELPYTTQSHTR